MDSRILLILAVLFSSLPSSSPARILGLSHYNGKSMFYVFQTLLKGLAERGHEVTFVNFFPQETRVPNYTDINIADSLPNMFGNVSLEVLNSFGILRDCLHFMFTLGIERCEKVLEHKNIRDLINSTETYDLVITLIFSADCLMSFAYTFNAPVVSLVTNVVFPWVNDRFGNPDNPAFIPNYFLPYLSSMNFFERMWNTLLLVETNRRFHYTTELGMDKIIRKHFKDESLPPIREQTKKSSLLLVNSHFSIHQPRPIVPALVEVGGMHIGKPKSPPEDIDTFLNEAEHGAIIFSLGTMVVFETFPKLMLLALLDAFADLPQRVLMKSGPLEGVPDNVKLVRWLPQLDVLCHPNVIAFYTHGGLLGTEEAIYCGVPFVGTPFFGDQRQNIKNFVKRGLAVELDYNSITKERVLEALRTVIQNPSYRQRVKQISLRFRDQPKSPLETAIYWTEYVIRHGGALHSRSAAADLTWFQSQLLDVVMVLLLVFVFSFCVYVFMKHIIFVIRKCRIINPLYLMSNDYKVSEKRKKFL